MSDIGERKLADALQKSEEKFSKAFRSSPAAMFIDEIDTDSFLDVNEAFERISGYRPEEVVGRKLSELGLFLDLHVLEEARRRVQEEGSYCTLETRIRKKSGEISTILFSAERITLDGTLCSIGGAVDVTHQRQVEQALRESQEFYRRLFEVEPDALVLVDRESGKIRAANAAASTIYGYAREELLSMNWIDLSGEPDKTVQGEMGKTLIPSPWHRKKDGTIFPVQTSICYFEHKGRPVFLCDVTLLDERQRARFSAEREAHKAIPVGNELSDLLESITEGFQALDEEFRLTYMNRAAARIIEDSSAESIGKPIWGEFPASISAEVEQQLRDVMRHRTAKSSETFDEKRCRWFLINVYPFRDGVSIVSRDISERKKSELQREQIIKELRYALEHARTLRGLIPICAWCKKIRSDEGYWQQLEAYITQHSEADFTHGMCPECAKLQLKEPGVL